MGRGRVWPILACLGVLLTGCTAGSSSQASVPAGISQAAQQTPRPSQTADRERALQVAVVTSGIPGDPFWDAVKTGAADAGMAENVGIDYQSSPDAGGQAKLIDAAVSGNVDGLIVSMSDPSALRESLQRAGTAGIPLITINAGAQDSAAFGALTHVGLSDQAAGQGAGARLREGGVSTLLCLVQDSGDPSLEQRCQGAADGLGTSTREGPKKAVITLPVNGANMSEAETTIASELQSNPSVDGVLALNPAVATAAERAIASTSSQAVLATFDLSDDVRQGIADGQILFAVDQQPYLQGYLPVVFLALYARDGGVVGGGQPVLTGPLFVTRDDLTDGTR